MVLILTLANNDVTSLMQIFGKSNFAFFMFSFTQMQAVSCVLNRHKDESVPAADDVMLFQT